MFLLKTISPANTYERFISLATFDSGKNSISFSIFIYDLSYAFTQLILVLPSIIVMFFISYIEAILLRSEVHWLIITLISTCLLTFRQPIWPYSWRTVLPFLNLLFFLTKVNFLSLMTYLTPLKSISCVVVIISPPPIFVTRLYFLLTLFLPPNGDHLVYYSVSSDYFQESFSSRAKNFFLH